MGYNILVTFPTYENLTQGLEDTFRNILYGAVGDVSEIKFVKNPVEYFSLMMGDMGSRYEVNIIFDLPGMRSEYIGLLGNIRFKNPQLKVLVVFPNQYKGTVDLKKVIIEKDICNILFVSDFNKINVGERVFKERTFEESILYGEVTNVYDEPGLIKWGTELDRGRKRSNDELIPEERTEVVYKNGYKIEKTTIYGRDALKKIAKENEESDDMDFLADDSFGIDRYDAKEDEMPYYEFPTVSDVVEEGAEQISNYFRQNGIGWFRQFENGLIGEVEVRRLASAVMEKLEVKMRVRKNPLEPAEEVKVALSDEEKEEAFRFFISDTKSYGKLDPIIDDDNVSDIRLLGPNNINVQIRGVWHRTNIRYKNEDKFRKFVGKVCNRNQVNLNIVNKDIIFSDIKTNPRARLRFSANSELIATDGLPGLHIRKIFKEKKSPDTLIREGLFTKMQLGYLISEVRKGHSIILCGGSGSGKTVALNLLIDYARSNICGACVQEAEEVFSDRLMNVQFLHTIEANGESKIGYDLYEASRSALLKNCELFIIGEIKGREAESYARAAKTNAQVFCTTHAKTLFDAIPNLGNLAKNAAGSSEQNEIQKIADNPGVVVFMSKYNVRQIAQVMGYDEKRRDIKYVLYKFQDEEG